MYVATHSAFTHNGVLYVAGGVTSNTSTGYASPSSTVWRAPIDADATLGEWVQDAASLMVAKSHAHQTPEYHGTFYSVGGAEGDITAASPDVELGVFH
jgi:hypothetical protein